MILFIALNWRAHLLDRHKHILNSFNFLLTVAFCCFSKHPSIFSIFGIGRISIVPFVSELCFLISSLRFVQLAKYNSWDQFLCQHVSAGRCTDISAMLSSLSISVTFLCKESSERFQNIGIGCSKRWKSQGWNISLQMKLANILVSFTDPVNWTVARKTVNFFLLRVRHSWIRITNFRSPISGHHRNNIRYQWRSLCFNILYCCLRDKTPPNPARESKTL